MLIALGSLIALLGLIIAGIIGYYKLSVADYYAASEKAFIMRYGGDEFIVIDTGRNDHLAGDLQAATAAYNRDSGMPFTISFSYAHSAAAV